MAAMLLSLRTARLVGLPSDWVWNAGLAAVLSAFFVSRLLLIVVSPHSFLERPLLVLALPSLTLPGVCVTVLLLFAYLRWKRLPVLTVLDAWAPCTMVVWLALSLGHFIEGTDAGMPTHLPWGILTPGDTILGKVQPVQIYAALISICLTLRLLWLLPQRSFDGAIAGRALVAGGVASFLLDFLRQPYETYGESWLDPSQYVALVLVLIGAMLFAWRKPLNVLQPQPEPETVYAE